MNSTVDVLILVGGLLVLLASGLEIAWSLGIMAAIGLVFLVNQPINELAWSSWASLNVFVLTAAPLFIFMGEVMVGIGAGESLFTGLEKWVGRWPGGLLNTVIAGNAVFAAMSGSSLAATSIFGRAAVPKMVKMGYDPSLTLGTVAVGATLAPLIPPSTILIIYGAWQGVPIAALFAGGLIPGIVLSALFIITIVIRAKFNSSLAPLPQKANWTEKIIALGQMSPFVIVIIGVLGVIFGGIMTPTEAAALGAFLSLVLAAVYRRFNMAMLTKCLLNAAKVTSFALFIYVMAIVVSNVVNIMGLFPRLTGLVLGLGIGKIGVLVGVCALYLIMGCLFDAWSMLFLTFPFVMPIITAVGIDPIWWGVIYVMAAEQSLFTPPFGMGLFVLHTVCPEYPIGTIVRGTFPFLVPIYLGIFLMAVFPQIVLWLPRALRLM